MSQILLQQIVVPPSYRVFFGTCFDSFAQFWHPKYMQNNLLY